MITTAVFVGFKIFLIGPMMKVWKGSDEPTGDAPMHDLLIALAFIGMVIAPAVVMAKTVPAESKID
jgi:hypothetical protein